VGISNEARRFAITYNHELPGTRGCGITGSLKHNRVARAERIVVLEGPHLELAAEVRG
jgi:hypothetical protein